MLKFAKANHLLAQSNIERFDPSQVSTLLRLAIDKIKKWAGPLSHTRITLLQLIHGQFTLLRSTHVLHPGTTLTRGTMASTGASSLS